MSGISRIGKFVAENRNVESFSDAERMREIPINIAMGADLSRKVTIMAITALNLALRCFRGTINFYFMSGNKASKKEHDGLIEILTNEANKADAPERVLFLNGRPVQGITLALGHEIPGSYTADCSGWLSYINRQAPSELKGFPAVSASAVFAVACTFAKLFKASALNNSLHTRESWEFSLLRFKPDRAESNFQHLGSINLGSISLIGAGAIGSGLAFVLSCSDYNADLAIIDKDRYEELNFETTMLISKSDELQLSPKATCIAAILNKTSRINSTGLIEEITSSSSILSAEKDFLICGVDNDETRRELDNTSAKIILNAGVGGRKEDAGHILISRHSKDGNVLLSSMYPEQNLAIYENRQVPKEFSDECSRVPYLNTAMAAPFLGTALGALLVAECVQEVLGLGIAANYLKFDLLNLQSRFQH